jgi:hypothetical protein
MAASVASGRKIRTVGAVGMVSISLDAAKIFSLQASMQIDAEFLHWLQVIWWVIGKDSVGPAVSVASGIVF